MECEKVRSLYTVFKEGNLDEAREREISEHIGGCRECKQLYNSLDKITTAARTFEEEKPQEQVIESILTQFENTPERRWFLAPRWVIAYTILLLFIAGFSIGLIRRINIQKQMVAQKKEQMIRREGKYIMDYGQFEKGQVIYSVPGAGNTIQVVETSY
jgi:predicted anti-sigma-YlaC factor YlaD